VFQKEFTSIHAFIGKIIRFILKALAGKKCLSETSGDKVLMYAGQPIVNMQVNMYANCAIILLLPELEMVCSTTTGAFATARSNCWASCGKISGASGKMSTETASEDDNFGTEQSCKSIMATFGSPYSSSSLVIKVKYNRRASLSTIS
jgi:hypothetical protein